MPTMADSDVQFKHLPQNHSKSNQDLSGTKVFSSSKIEQIH